MQTPAGALTLAMEAPTAFIPITAIVPAMHAMGERAMDLEVEGGRARGEHISCRMGCAACCRMLVPVSAPEALALKDLIECLPAERRQALSQRIDHVQERLEEEGLLEELQVIAETDRQLSDEEMEPVNRAYYNLRIPCPFLENEVCSIYEYRPAACRELLVTTPAEFCQDFATNPVQAIPVPLRMSTVLGMLWSQLSGGPVRFIPLPVALPWARRHAETGSRTWPGVQILEHALEQVYRFLSGEFSRRGIAVSETTPPDHRSKQ
jgi:Fe-S-cluster containining protein